MTDKSAPINKRPRFRKRLLRTTAVVLTTLVVLCIALTFYLQSQKNKVADYVIEYLDDRYGGEIELLNRPGGGTRALLSLPR